MIILVTGSSRGIGKKISEFFLDDDHTVIGCSRGNSSINQKKYRHFSLSVSDEAEVMKLFFYIRKEFGKLDVLINNAGIASMNHSILTPLSTARDILEVNVLGNFLFSRESAKIMKKHKWGRIINFVTFAIPFKLEGEAIYAASKAAVVSLTEILSREYAGFGITVNAIAPPAVKTDLIRGVPDETLNKLLSRQAIHRYGTPEEIYGLIKFLVKPESDMITGQTIYMGGV